MEGLSPSKERHEFFLDVVPRLGLPFAAQPRYQGPFTCDVRKHLGFLDPPPCHCLIHATYQCYF